MKKRKSVKLKESASSSLSLQPEVTCSVCNRHFRAKIGFNSNQRTHNHTLTQYSGFKMVFLRDELISSKLKHVKGFKKNLNCAQNFNMKQNS